MLNESRCFLVMPCAGSGLRAGGDVAKQYQMLQGLPLVVRSLQSLSRVSSVKNAVLVVSPEDRKAQELMQAYGCASWFDHFSVLAQGGATRMESVLAGVRSLADLGAQEHDWVLVHDAARCLVQAPWVEQLIREVGDDAVGGILAWPLSDTLKQARPCNPIAGDTAVPNERIVATIPRAHKWLAQTPQMFRLGALRQALERALQEMQRPKAGQGAGLEPLVTDEASALEAMGLSPLLVQASALNIKITYAEDFVLAQALLGVLGDV